MDAGRAAFVPALGTSRLKSDDSVSLQSWRFGGILSYLMFESLVICGFALRILGRFASNLSLTTFCSAYHYLIRHSHTSFPSVAVPSVE